MTDLADVIAKEHRNWGTAAIDIEIFGTGDAVEVAAAIDEVCRQGLGAGVTEGLFYRASTGCAAGVRLSDGEPVVVKAYQERWTASFLNSVQTIQRHLVAHDFPCPAPVGDTTPLRTPGSCLVTFERYLADPGLEPLVGDESRRGSAVGLARQINLCRALQVPGLAVHPLETPSSGLYPIPHSPLFDFEATTEGAEWIDDFARQAQALRRPRDMHSVPGHTDWSARNIRVRHGVLVAAYDWDSLSLVPETTAVGQAAATWCVTSEPEGNVFPTAASMAAYIEDYQSERGQDFSPDEWRAISGAALWVVAYTARCEHSLAFFGRTRPDQDASRSRLRAEGAGISDLYGAKDCTGG